MVAKVTNIGEVLTEPPLRKFKNVPLFQDIVEISNCRILLRDLDAMVLNSLRKVFFENNASNGASGSRETPLCQFSGCL